MIVERTILVSHPDASKLVATHNAYENALFHEGNPMLPLDVSASISVSEESIHIEANKLVVDYKSQHARLVPPIEDIAETIKLLDLRSLTSDILVGTLDIVGKLSITLDYNDEASYKVVMKFELVTHHMFPALTVEFNDYPVNNGIREAMEQWKNLIRIETKDLYFDFSARVVYGENKTIDEIELDIDELPAVMTTEIFATSLGELIDTTELKVDSGEYTLSGKYRMRLVSPGEMAIDFADITLKQR